MHTGWDATHRYYQALREIEAALDRAGDGLLPWQPSYAEVFGTPAHMLAALRTRWDRLVRAQADTPEQLAELAAAHRGLVLTLELATRPRLLAGAA